MFLNLANVPQELGSRDLTLFSISEPDNMKVYTIPFPPSPEIFQGERASCNDIETVNLQSSAVEQSKK